MESFPVEMLPFEIQVGLWEDYLDELDRWLMSMTSTFYLSLKPAPNASPFFPGPVLADSEFSPRGYGYLIAIAALKGYISIVDIFLRENKLTDRLMLNAICGGHTQMVHHLEVRECPANPSLCIQISVASEKLEMFAYMWEKYSTRLYVEEDFEIYGYSADKSKIYRIIGGRGNICILEYLKEKDPEYFGLGMRAAAIGAATKGRIPVLEWLRENKCEGLKTIGITAARYGQLPTLKFLVKKKYKLSPDVFSSASYWGDTNILEYLLSIGCTWNENTCGLAAMGGNLETLQWLKSRGCPWGRYVIRKAKLKGYNHIVTWARENGCPE